MEQDQGCSHRPAEQLLNRPEDGQRSASEMPRAEAVYESLDDRFLVGAKVYDRQYAQLYFQRLSLLRPRVLEQIKIVWPGVRVARILNLPEGQEVAVIGTLYKDQKLKPSVLDEYVKGGPVAAERGVPQLLGHTKFAGPDDTAVLEDDSARMVLRGPALPVQQLVTGVVLAVRGSAVPGGDFQVTDVCYARMPPQPQRDPAQGQGRSVALLSGLGLGDENCDPLRLGMAVDHLTGLLCAPADQHSAAQVVLALIAGGIMRANEAALQSASFSRSKNRSAVLAPVRDMDVLLSELAGAMTVDAMPGPTDPTNLALPQQPLHRCLFPGAMAFPSFHRAPNPHAFSVAGVRFVATSGQNIDDLWRYSAEEDRLELLQRCIEWGHLVPTAPDTLTTYPFHDRDPFVVSELPHVYVVGNQPSFKTCEMMGPDGQRVRLICVPKFESSSTLLLLDLESLDVRTVRFLPNPPDA